jgi:hypothetical protein
MEEVLNRAIFSWAFNSPAVGGELNWYGKHFWTGKNLSPIYRTRTTAQIEIHEPAAQAEEWNFTKQWDLLIKQNIAHFLSDDFLKAPDIIKQQPEPAQFIQAAAQFTEPEPQLNSSNQQRLWKKKKEKSLILWLNL